jgi:hypothetical protein
MQASSVRAVFAALNKARVKFLVVGGLAVNAHGYLRFTADVDLVVRLEAANVNRAFAALLTLGYRPMVPVTARSFADEPTRAGWIRDKNMKVLRFFSNLHRETVVDIFVTEPFSFSNEYRIALKKRLKGMAPARFVTLKTLLRMKKDAGRPQDLIDLHELGGKLSR